MTQIRPPSKMRKTKVISFFKGEEDGRALCQQAASGNDQNGSLLVPHPTDCSKFFNCQSLGNNQWKAHVQICPPSTGFDAALQICNFIDNLPRCLYKKRV